MWQLHNFDIDDFLANYWQKKPLLVRQALPGFETVLSPEELAGLACEQGVHSRLIIEKDAAQPWQLRYGPFQETDFTSLPDTHYSLLVSECEKWMPELQDLVTQFSFIPRWRIDDLMISYAPEHGSVGPHIDEYDVFLIQANGQRRWAIIDEAQQDPALIADLDLAIMREFNEDRAWILEPGDMLYLPPRIAHHGVAVGDGCMTYSVGFRAQTAGDVMDSFLFEASERQYTDKRYYDPPLTRDRDPAEITQDEIAQFRSMVLQMVEDSAELWPDIVGKLVSDATLSDDVQALQCETFDEVRSHIWQKHPDARFVFHQSKALIRFYYSGQVHQLGNSPEHLEWCSLLGNESIFEFVEFDPPAAIQSLLLELINHSALIPVLDDDD